MTRNNNYTIGIGLIAVAVVLMLGKLGVFTILGKLFWPFLILGLGLLIHVLFYMRLVPAAVLVPGGILVTYSFIFMFCNVFGWHFMKFLWPGFIFGVAVGLYEMYIMGAQRSRAIFVAALILAVVSAVFFSMTLLLSLSVYLIALVLLLLGFGLIFRRPRTW